MIQRGKHAVQQSSLYAVAIDFDRRPNSYFVFSAIYAGRPGHAKHARDEPEQSGSAKEKNFDKKNEAGKETRHGEHAWHEHAGNEYVRNAQAHAAKKADRAKKTVNHKTSNGQYAGDEDARNEHASG